MRLVLRLLAFASFAWILSANAADVAAPASPAPAEAPAPVPVFVRMDTTLGSVLFELDPGLAPKTVANFLQYVKSGFYDGLIFHRVIAGFMAQGGGYDVNLKHREGGAPVRNEADNGLHNMRGTLAMARTEFPHSATSEFYINLANNYKLDYPGRDGWGYTVFGAVVEGMDVVGKMAAIPTGPGGIFDTDVPLDPIVIQHMRVVDPPSPPVPAPATPPPTPATPVPMP